MKVVPLFLGSSLLVAGTALTARYRRDLSRARRRVNGLDRRIATSLGPVEYCESGDGPPVLLVHGVVGGRDVPPSWTPRTRCIEWLIARERRRPSASR